MKLELSCVGSQGDEFSAKAVARDSTKRDPIFQRYMGDSAQDGTIIS
jgi:hypothetical protein